MTDNTPAEQEEGEALPPADISFHDIGLHPQSVKALEAMAYEGMSLHLAAKREGIRPDNFARTFNKPHIRRVYNQVVKAIRDNAAAQAYVRNVNLAQSSNSDHVKADLNKWIAGVDGIAAVKRVEGRMHHQHSFGGFDYDDDEPVDVTPEDTQSPADDGASPIEQGVSGDGGTHDVE
ncbi:hypothetical protein [Ruegeria sp. EL01]|jgi:hypothetical protein|uniref:hypothetical protein n=1 Tax=Ruegeria sp. EL01 TaxID=2107578 RepID=UPI000EA8322A|nr:hypothetical protein [Ruegeria sp. EL01]